MAGHGVAVVGPVAPELAEQRGHARPWWVVALLGLGYAGYIKGTPVMAGLPVDLTLAMAIACAVGIMVQFVRGYWFHAKALTVVLGLWVVFGVGALMVVGSERGESKVALLGTVTLLCALTPCYLLTGVVAQRWLLASTLVAAAVFVAAATFMPDTEGFGRFNLAGTSTIGTSRVVGAGIVVAGVYALAGTSKRWIWCAAAAVGTAALVAVGSRGPFVALLVSTVIVVITAKVFRGRRPRAIGMGVAAVTVLMSAVLVSSSRSAGRILRLVTGDEPDVARAFLAREAWRSIVHNPLGLGWGNFSATRSIELAYGGRPVYPHNLTLEIMVEGGWLAGALFLMLVYFSIRGFVRASDSRDRTALLGLGVYWFAVAQTSSDINGNRMTWIILTLGLILDFAASARGARLGLVRREWGRRQTS
jgi:O-antigen ligase